VIAAAKGQGKFGDAALDMAKTLTLMTPAVKAVASTLRDKSKNLVFSLSLSLSLSHFVRFHRFHMKQRQNFDTLPIIQMLKKIF
jgi:hypothetical protein